MATNSLVYSNAIARSMETTLLSADKLARLVSANSLEDGVKILTESNYGGTGVQSAADYENILSAEEERAGKFLRESMPKKSGLEAFLKQYDYHNLKAFLKAAAAKLENVKPLLAPQGEIAPETLEKAVAENNFSSLPENMRRVAEKISAAAAATPYYIDAETDKAMYTDIIGYVKKSGAAELIRYYELKIAAANLSSFIRCRNAKLDVKYFKQTFVGESGECGLYEKLYDAGADVIAETLKFKRIGALASIAVEENKKGRALIAFERELDNELLNIFKSRRYDIFSVAPIAGFFVAKNIEILNVRMCLTCLKNGSSESAIKERLRESYA